MNTWTHVALTFDGATANTYINGVGTRSITGLSGSVGTSASPLKIGARSDTEIGLRPHDRFNGLIDEPAIYGRALTEMEIQTIVATSSAGLCKPCDANGDGVIRFNDALAVIKFLRTGQLPPGNGDCYPDGMLNFQDVSAILRALRKP